MSQHSRFVSLLRNLFGWRRQERELSAELDSYLKLLTEEKIQSGLSPEEAARAVRIEVGGIEQVKEQVRESQTGIWLQTAMQDLRYGIRVLAKNPGFTLLVLLTLALGIGANTAIFSAVYGVLLQPLPYLQGSQLVVLHQQATQTHLANVPFSVKEIEDYRNYSHTLDSLAEYHSMPFLLLDHNTAFRVQTGVVSSNYFEVLGVTPLLGRTFLSSDEAPNADGVLVLSYEYWQHALGGDPHIIGRTFEMNSKPHTVIGVLPPIPQYPGDNDVYMTTVQCPFRASQAAISNRARRFLTVVGRIKSQVSLGSAQADLSTIARQISSSYPASYPSAQGYGVLANSLHDELTQHSRTTLLVLFAAAGFVLLIACANVANLLLSRLLRRERELAVRSALGATKSRLIRQLLTETVLLSVAGGLLGLALASPVLKVMVNFVARFTTRASEVHINGWVLIFTLLISVISGILFGLGPALSAGEQQWDVLKQAGGQSTATRGHQRLRTAFVVLQVAFSFVMLIGAGLMIRSFMRLQRVDPGINVERVLSLRLTPNFAHYTKAEQQLALARGILTSTGSVPAVESVSLASSFPFGPDSLAIGPGNVDFQIEGRPAASDNLSPVVDTTGVSPDYFETVRQPLVQGRLFSEHDDAASLPVAIINQTMARHRWPNEEPIGKRMSFDQGKAWTTIVGIVGDAREYGLDRAVQDEVYLPVAQSGFATNLLIRTRVEPTSIAPLIARALHSVDPEIALDRVTTLERLREDSVESPKVTTILLGIFAGLALVISASGIAGVMALTVSQRTRELGIRMALGQPKNAVIGMVLRQGLGVTLAGTCMGLAASVIVARLLASLLYATSPMDAITFATVSLVFFAVATAACFIPAHRVTLIDPFTALRQE